MAFHPFASTIIPVLPSRSDSDSPALSPSRINKRDFSPGQIRRELRRFLPAMTQARGFSRAGACVVLHYFASERSSVTVVSGRQPFERSSLSTEKSADVFVRSEERRVGKECAT